MDDDVRCWVFDVEGQVSLVFLLPSVEYSVFLE
jgi:hypothetical protein